MHFVTDFADLAVVGPLAACVAAAFAAAGWGRGAMAWCAAICATLGMMLCLKLLCLGCVRAGEFAFSPSGHVAAGTVLYGGMLGVWLRRRLPVAVCVILGGVPVAALVAASRLALHLHSLPEVWIGAGVGLCGLTLMLWWTGAPPGGLRARRAALLIVPLVVLLHGVRVPAEARIRAAAGWLPAGVCAALGA